jgi:hypothetical protein
MNIRMQVAETYESKLSSQGNAVVAMRIDSSIAPDMAMTGFSLGHEQRLQEWRGGWLWT